MTILGKTMDGKIIHADPLHLHGDDCLTIEGLLTEEQRGRILDEFCKANPNGRGATVADVLSELNSTDGNLSIVEPMYEYFKTAKPRWTATHRRFIGHATRAVAYDLSGRASWPTAVATLVERAFMSTMPSIDEVIRNALIERGWTIDETAEENWGGELREFIDPDTGRRVAWLDALERQRSRET